MLGLIMWNKRLIKSWTMCCNGETNIKIVIKSSKAKYMKKNTAGLDSLFISYNEGQLTHIYILHAKIHRNSSVA